MIGSIDREISLYFHIPFCTRKCDYCHFYVIPDNELAKDQLLEGFKSELSLLKAKFKDKEVVTLYFGGGTPSLFGPVRIAALLDHLHKNCSISSEAEITLEANPENITAEAACDYAKAGINRISIGIQTLDHQLLLSIGRLHTPHLALKAIETVYQAGITNISIDLMYDLPHQTLQHWQKTLELIKPLPLQHLSLYNLTIEPHTLFFKKQEQLRPFLPKEEESLIMYESAIEFLEEMGLFQYEISAFAKPFYESKHNSGYWTGRSFLGLGPSAFSYWEGKRFRNVAHLGRYCSSLKEGILPIDFEEKLDPDAHRRELFVIYLRLKKGVSLHEFVHNHGPLEPEMQTALNQFVKENLLTQNDQTYRLTKKGILFYDTIAAELI